LIATNRRPKELPVRVARSLLALALFAPALGPLAAQTPIRFGLPVTGRLTTTDQQFSDGSRYKMYAFVGNKGDTIAVNLTSDDFDANIVLADASGNRLTFNDDGGEKCNARLTYVLPQAANYRLYANSSRKAELGEFRLSLARGKAATPADTACRDFGLVSGLIQVGQTVTGALSANDPEITGDSTYYQRWILPVTANQPFTVDLESADFDAYIILTRGRGEQLVQNDDGGGGCNARLVYTATDDHPLRVIVNTASRPRRQTGRFTLRVSDGESPTEPKGNCRFTGGAATAAGAAMPNRPAGNPAAPSSARTIAVGQTQQGSLTSADVVMRRDSTYVQAWTIDGRAGQTVTIDLESDDFDAYVFLRGPGIAEDQALQDDDSGGNCNARLTASFPQAGEYEIVVNSAGAKYATGSFSLSVTSGSKAKSVARCSRSQ
jgi:hypothetical protein